MDNNPTCEHNRCKYKASHIINGKNYCLLHARARAFDILMATNITDNSYEMRLQKLENRIDAVIENLISGTLKAWTDTEKDGEL